MKTAVTDVFFDLDHTLWDFERNSALAFAGIFQKHALPYDLEAFLKVYVPINLEYWERFRKDEISREQLRYGRFQDAFSALGVSVTHALIDQLSDDYIEHLPLHNHLFDGTLALLDYLKPKYKLHIITNGFALVQDRKIANANIGHYFASVTNSEMAGVKKPHRGIFEHALQKAGAVKAQSIMIGDCIDADVRGALDFGIDAILFSPAGHSGIPNIKQVQHLSEIKQYL